MRSVTLALVLTLSSPSIGSAADKAYAVYSITAKRAAVKGKMSVGGYSAAQVREFVQGDCSGQVGTIKLFGKPRRKRGVLWQKFKTSCTGGPSQSFNSHILRVEVERLADGRDLAEYTFSQNGTLAYSRKLR